MLPVTNWPKRRRHSNRRRMRYNPFRKPKRFSLAAIAKFIIPIALLLLLSLNNVFVSDVYRANGSSSTNDEMSRSLQSFRDDNTGAHASMRARAMTIDEIIRMQETANEKVPRLRRLTSEPDANDNNNADEILSKIHNDFEHDEPKPDDEDSAAGRPEKSRFMVIHIGPPATGARRFQKETALNPGMAEALAKDGILYVGTYSPDETHNDFINQKICSQIFLRNKLDLEILKSIDPFGEMPLASGLGTPDQICTSKRCLKDCWSNNEGEKYDAAEDEAKENKDASESRRLNVVKNMLEYNGIIQSNEKSSWVDRQGSLKAEFIYEETGFWKDYLDYDEIIAVAAYRRYFSWLLGVYNEMVMDHCLPEPDLRDLKVLVEEGGLADRGRVDEMTILWADQNEYRKKSLWPKEGGNFCPQVWEFVLPHIIRTEDVYRSRIFQNIDETVPLMEAVLNSTTNIDSGGSDEQEKKPYGRVEILNYYQKQDEYNSITTEFYCRVLGEEKTPHACEYAKNNLGPKGPRIPLVNDKVFYDKIVVTAYDKGWFKNTTNGEDLKIVNYVPKEKGAPMDFDTIATTTHRIQVRNELMKYHTETLQKTYADLPLLCPMRNDLQHLLDKSITFEKLVQPEFAESPDAKDDHIMEFWDLHESEKTFCWVDIQRLFKGVRSWDELLQNSLTQTWGIPKRTNIKRVWAEQIQGAQTKPRRRGRHS